MTPVSSSFRTSHTPARVRAAVRDSLQNGLAQGIFPGAVAAVIHAGPRGALEAVGYTQITPRRHRMSTDTIFDLASLTKPLVTTTAILQLCSRGLLGLDVPVAAYLPAFAADGNATATIRHLLTHTSGLPFWEMLYLPGPRRSDGRRAPACQTIYDAVTRIGATPTSSPPGSKVEYSDLGFIVLGHLVERLSGQTLDSYTQRDVTRPLGLRWTRFRPPLSWRSRCAATELGNAYEQARAAEQGVGHAFRWRRHLLRGEVHDGNAYYLGGGVAGHAGLFGSARDVARFGLMLLHRGVLSGRRIVDPPVMAEAVRDQTPGLTPGGRGLGWAVAQPWFGAKASKAAFGHTGFTGTSVLIDPAREVAIVLLTNRVHPTADSNAIVEFRPAFHDAVLDALDATGRGPDPRAGSRP